MPKYINDACRTIIQKVYQKFSQMMEIQNNKISIPTYIRYQEQQATSNESANCQSYHEHEDAIVVTLLHQRQEK